MDKTLEAIINDIVFIMKEMLNEDKTKNSLTTLNYIYHFLSILTILLCSIVFLSIIMYY